jgi:hypothetical protein
MVQLKSDRFAAVYLIAASVAALAQRVFYRGADDEATETFHGRQASPVMVAGWHP